MPPEPSSSLVSQYVLENPWPLGLLLLLIAVVLAWYGLSEGVRSRVRVASIFAGLGAIVLVLGALVSTPGEHGERVIRSLVDAVVNEDLVGGMAMLSDDATMNAGTPHSPGLGFAAIRDRFAALAERYTIESNLIMSIDGVSLPDQQAEVRITCRTNVEGFPVISNWTALVKKQSGSGEWRVARLTCLSINGETVPVDRLW
jgi:hypothetical protein